MKCSNCSTLIVDKNSFCASCGMKFAADDSIPVTLLRETLYARYLDIFENETNKEQCVSYDKLISETVMSVISDFYIRYFEAFLSEEINAGDIAKMTYPLYKYLRMWFWLQMRSGIRLVISRRLVNGEKIEKIGDFSKDVLVKYIDSRFWNVNLEDMLDPVMVSLVIKDAEQAVEVIKRKNESINALSIGFLRRFTGRLVWSTVYGVLLATYSDPRN